MLNRTPLFQATDPAILGAGLQPDLHLVQRVLWADASNVSFQNGRVRKRSGDTLMQNYGALPIRGITQMQDSDGVRWLWGGSGPVVKRWYGPPIETIYTAASWVENQTVNDLASYWDMLPYGDWMILNNGVGKPVVWKPTAAAAPLGDVPANVVTMMKKQNFVLALGYGAAKTRVGWSNADIIDEWTADDDNLAGSLTIAEFDTPIRAAAPLGEAIALFAEDQMAVLNYIGAPFIFGFKMRLDGIGCVGKAACASDGKNIVGVGRNGVWWTDSLTLRYIDEGQIRTYLQENVNWDQASKIVAARNDVTACFDFSFPMGASLVPNEGWSFDPMRNAWYRIPAFSHKDERRLFRRVIVGGLTGNLSLEQDTATGPALSLKTRPLLAQLQDASGLRDVHNNVNVQETDILLKAAEHVEWRLGAAQEADAAPQWGPWTALTPATVTYKTPRGVPSGVYHTLEFRSTDPAWQFDLQGFMLFGQMEGTKRRAAA
jgi:hypothetical protein